MNCIKINIFKEHLQYDCSFDLQNKILKASNEQNEKIEIVAKNIFGLFEWIWNSIGSLFGKNNWVKICIDDSYGRSLEFFLNVDSIRKELLYASSETHTLNKLRRQLTLALNNRLEEKAIERIFLGSLSYEERENYFNAPIKQLYNSFNSLNPQTENLTLDELKGLFHYINKHKAAWIREMKKKNHPYLYLRHNSDRIRTLRVERNGDVFIILKILIGKGADKKVRLSIDVNKRKLVVHAIGIEIKEKIIDDEIVKLNQRQKLITNFTTPVVHKNVAKQGNILNYIHFKNGKGIRKMAVIMPYFNEKDMVDFIHSKQKLTGEQKKQIVLDTLRGLKAIHDAGLVHSDIKPDNIFIKRILDENGKVKKYVAKIGDFGGIKSPKTLKGFENIGGTLEYYAPEMWAEVLKEESNPKITFAIDCYSMGVSLGLFLGLPLARHFTEISKKYPVLGLNVHSPNKKNIGTPEYLITQLIRRNPEKRISIEKAIALAKITNF